MPYRIGKTFRFSASHHLPLLPDGHKCRRDHGHNYEVTIEVEADTLDDRGFVVDYAEFDKVKDRIVSEFDHYDLNEVAWRYAQQPTAEHLAHYITSIATAFLDSRRVSVCRVTVKETPDTFATCEERR